MDFRGQIHSGLVALFALSRLAFSHTELTFSAIQEEIQGPQSSVHSLEDFLWWVRNHHPEQMEYFTFMRQSGSLQEASPTFPRAIVYGPSGRLVFTFNGDVSHEGYNVVEVMHFHEPDSQSPQDLGFEFRELTFHTNGEVGISPPNPGKCVRCHYSPLRPIWDPYELWHGAYGKRDDGIVDIPSFKYLNFSPTPRERIEYDEELVQYRAFQAIKDGHERYNKLIYPAGSPVSPYSPRHRGDYNFRTNLRLTKHLGGLHAKHVFTQIISQKACAKRYGALLAAELMQCEAVRAYRPSPGDPNIFIPYSKFEDQLKAHRKITQKNLEKKFPQIKVAYWIPDPQFYQGLPQLLSLMGVEQANWNLSQKPNQWRYYEGSRYIRELVGEHLYHWLHENDERLPSLSSIHFSFVGVEKLTTGGVKRMIPPPLLNLLKLFLVGFVFFRFGVVFLNGRKRWESLIVFV